MNMGELVEMQFKHAMQALSNSNANLARHIIDQDQQVNRLEVEIDALCCNAIACYKPTASDLRSIVTSTKIIMHLERIGDEAKKIAHISERRAHQYNLAMPRFLEISHATESILESLRDVLDSFALLDFISAQKVIDRIGLGKENFENILRNLVEFMTDHPHTISTSLEFLLVTKAIERINDHVKSIAELVMESSNRYYDMQYQPVQELEI